MERNPGKHAKARLSCVILLFATVLVVLPLCGCLRMLGSQLSFSNEPASDLSDLLDPENAMPPVQTKLDFAVSEQSEPLEVEYYFEPFDGGVHIFDSAYLDRLFDPGTIGKNELLEALNSNTGMSEKYKRFLAEYIDLLFARYPDNNYRIFYENLKNLKVVECKDKIDLFYYALSWDSYACFIAKDDAIYTLADYEYTKGTWEYQIIMHEISHALRTYWDDEHNNHAQFTDLTVGDVIEEEAMNSIFTVSLFDYEERDIAYQLQSNIFQILVSSMDNYDLNDYVNHSASYFAKKLDEYTGHTNYAASMLKVLEAQYDDFHSDYIELEQSELYPLYDFICDVYLKGKVNEETTDEEKTALLRTLVDDVLYDVPEDYHIDTNYFMSYFQRAKKAGA